MRTNSRTGKTRKTLSVTFTPKGVLGNDDDDDLSSEKKTDKKPNIYDMIKINSKLLPSTYVIL